MPTSVKKSVVSRLSIPADGTDAIASGIDSNPPIPRKNPSIRVSGVTLKLLTGETI